jgi:hypothetical protein
MLVHPYRRILASLFFQATLKVLHARPVDAGFAFVLLDLFKPYTQIRRVTEVFEESFVLNALAHVVHFTRVCSGLSAISHA